MAKKNKYTIRKYEGDDMYSWAVFKNLPKGLPSIISYGEAHPVVCGCSRSEADHYKRVFEGKQENS